MLSRISLLFFIVAALCSTAFTLGGMAAKGRQDASGIPAEHPVSLAYRYQQELGLSGDQVIKLGQLRDELAKEFAPLRERAESLQHRMQELQQSGTKNEDAANKLKLEGEELGAKLKPLFDRYSKSVGDLLTQEQREKLMKLSEANASKAEGHEFPLMVALQSREQLGITPQQFTKLQYLQADFIRAFAPLREAMELLQMEMQEKFGKAGQEPNADYREKGEALQKQVSDLQAQFSSKAVKDVLSPDQRAKLEELLHGERRAAKDGG